MKKRMFYNLNQLLKKWRIILILITCFTFIFIHVCFKNLKRTDTNNYQQLNRLDLKYVVVHIDLKGAPPRLEFLMAMLPELKSLGANALLMEYEDMFPYENKLVNLSKRGHYTKSELKKFLIKAKELDLEVIPLIQTFGHMEWVLEVKEFEHLRENTKKSDSICPSKAESIKLIENMLEQVIDFHTSVMHLNHFHIGCDEVFQINLCKDCKEKNLTKHKLFMKHVDTVSNLVWNLSPDTKILIWDDMLRSMKITEWEHFKKRPKIEPVYWMYHEKFGTGQPHLPMYLYHQHFQNIWVASAFKGADGMAAAIPDYKRRIMNTLTWLKIIDNYVFGGETQVYSFRGIILTGWSRYSHFRPLCELLPTSYRSLVSSLILVNKFKAGVRLDRIDWRKGCESIFHTHFLQEYLSQTGCVSIGPSGTIRKTCILYKTNELYKNIELFENFLKRIQVVVSLHHKQSKFVWKPNKMSAGFCSTKYGELRDLEKRLEMKLEYFYSREVQTEYVNRSSVVHRKLKTCS